MYVPAKVLINKPVPEWLVATAMRHAISPIVKPTRPSSLLLAKTSHQPETTFLGFLVFLSRFFCVKNKAINKAGRMTARVA
jgi:hypothetical protein